MAEKPAKKTVSIAIKRGRLVPPKFLVATGFRLKQDKQTGLVEVLLNASSQRGERVTLDPVVVGSNLGILKQYAAGLGVEADDSAEMEDVIVGESNTFSNIIFFTHMGHRAETTFSAFSLHDWVEASRQPKGGAAEVTSYDALIAVSTAAFQKKLVSELMVLLAEKPETP
jgi:hypothetical protein